MKIKQYKILFFLLAVLLPAALSATVNVTQAPYLADNTGTYDATNAIQDALDDATANGEHVYLPAGTYLISSPLSVSGNLNGFQICVYGDGRTTDGNGTIIRATANMDYMLLHYGNKITLYKIRFEGDHKAKTIIQSGAAQLDGTSLPKIMTVSVTGSTEIAVFSKARLKCDGVSTGVISYLIIDDCGAGIIWYGNTSKYYQVNGEYCKMVVDNLRISNTGSYAAMRYGYSFSRCDDFQITNDYAYIGNHPNLQSAVCFMYDSCLMDGGHYAGMLRGPTAGEGCHNFIIRNYVIENCFVAVSTDLRMIECVETAKYGDGIGDNGLGGDLGGLITDNYITNCSVVWFCQGHDIKFANNTIVNCPGGSYFLGAPGYEAYAGNYCAGIMRFNGSQTCIIGGGNSITGLNNKRIIYATYNVNEQPEPDTSETSLIYLYEDENDFDETTLPDYCVSPSQIIVM